MMMMMPTMMMACSMDDTVSSWNDNIRTLPGEIAGWLYRHDGKVNPAARFDKDKEVFTFGVFVDNVAVGLTWQSRTMRKMDGFLYGEVDNHGDFTGDNITFIYPDFLTGLRGYFKDGVLVAATAVDIVAERCNAGVKELRIEAAQYDSEVVWEKDETSLRYIGKNRKVMDAYERKSVYVKKSTNPVAFEGLFARRNFLPGDIVSYYGGQKVYNEEKVFDNMTLEEKYEVSACHLALGKRAPVWLGLPPDLLVDVSAEFRSVVEYRTTLGHKANHSFDNNVEYWVVNHPVLGAIACLVAQTEIDVGQEIFAHYRYNKVNLAWYNEEYDHVYGARCYARKKSC